MKDRLVPWKRRGELLQWERDDHPFDMLHREIDDLFETYYRGVGRMGRHPTKKAGFELSEMDDEIQVKIEMPGIEEKDIQVTVDEDTLTVRGKRREQKETSKRNYRVSEMSYGDYRHTIPLPARIDRENAKAEFKRGVLTLTLPKTTEARAERKRIPVSVD